LQITCISFSRAGLVVADWVKITSGILRSHPNLRIWRFPPDAMSEALGKLCSCIHSKPDRRILPSVYPQFHAKIVAHWSDAPRRAVLKYSTSPKFKSDSEIMIINVTCGWCSHPIGSHRAKWRGFSCSATEAEISLIRMPISSI
jgi:hypothetical protein